MQTVPLWKLNADVASGQSLSVGYEGTAVSLTQPYSNVQLWDTLGASGGYDITNPYAATLEFQPLVAPMRANDPYLGVYDYPTNVFGESPDVAYVNNRTALALADGYSQYVGISSCTGIGGVSITSLIKYVPPPNPYGNAYAAGIYETTAINYLTSVNIVSATIGNPTTVYAPSHGLNTGNYVFIRNATGMTELNGYWKVTVTNTDHFTVPLASSNAYVNDGYFTSHGVSNILWTHGETDSFYYVLPSSYGPTLLQLLSDYNSDISAITGQTQPIYLIASQQNSTGLFASQAPNGNTVANCYNGLIGTTLGLPATGFYLSGPKYQYPYAGSNDPHLTGAGYRAVGEKYAQVGRNIEKYGDWKPTYPTSIVKNNGSANGVGTTSVTATFNVPVPPLVYDTTTFTPSKPHQSGILSAAWSNAFGFEATDVTTLHITNATNASPIQVTTSTNHGLTTGNVIFIPNAVSGNTATNGCWTITYVDPTNFTLDSSTGNGSFTGSNTAFSPYEIAIALPITSAILSGNQVTITLTSAASTQLLIGYADTPDAAPGYYSGGPANDGRFGCLRDSDPYQGLSGTPNQNWAVEWCQNIS